MKKHTLLTYIKHGFSQRKIAELEHCSQCKVRYWLNIFKLKTVRPIKSPGLCIRCGNPTKPRGIKFCSNDCCTKFRKEQNIYNFVAGVTKLNPELGNQIRRYILATRKHQCVICNHTTWRTKEIPLIVDHEDGNYRNVTEKNLRLVCPNCDAQLDTYKGRNRGHGRFKRRQRYLKKESY